MNLNTTLRLSEIPNFFNLIGLELYTLSSLVFDQLLGFCRIANTQRGAPVSVLFNFQKRVHVLGEQTNI